MTAPAATSAVKKQIKLEDLSPTAREVTQTRRITGNWDAKHLVRLLGELAHVDEAFERQAKSAQNKMILFIVLAFVSIFVGAFTSAFLGGWAFLLLPLMIVLAILFGIKWRKLKKLDLINDFRLCLRPVLRDIANDLDHDKKIKVEMDLCGPADRKQKSKMEIPPGAYIKVTETVYQDPWCQVKLPLADGSTVILEFENCYRKYDVRKRGRRGKIKFKTKWRKECTASATMLPPSAANWNEQQLQSRLNGGREKLKFVEKDGLRGARLEGFWGFKGASDVPSDAPPGKAIVGMLLRLHSAMKPEGGSK
jgi:hypothetical protein